MKKTLLKYGFVVFSVIGMIAGVVVKSLVHGYKNINIGIPGGGK